MLARMKDLWAGIDWSEEDEQREMDRRALRILSCPRAACRRRRLCLAADKRQRCPTAGLWPQSEEEAWRRQRALIRALERDVAEYDANPVAQVEAEQRAAWTEADKRWRSIAFQRAKATLRASGKSERS
jgi:hypothetical protein